MDILYIKRKEDKLTNCFKIIMKRLKIQEK